MCLASVRSIWFWFKNPVSSLRTSKLPLLSWQYYQPYYRLVWLRTVILSLEIRLLPAALLLPALAAIHGIALAALHRDGKYILVVVYPSL